MSHTLICFALGDADVTVVDIDETKLVGHLKDEIKKKHPQTLATVNEAALTLYRAELVSSEVSSEETFIKELNRLSRNLHECKKLAGWQPLSTYLGERPSQGKMYVFLVQAPQGESMKSRLCGAVAETDVFASVPC